MVTAPDTGTPLTPLQMGVSTYAGGGSSPGNVSGGGHGIGEPGFWTGMIPVYGSGRSAINAFQAGHPWRGVFYGAMAASDVFLAKALVVGIAKGAVFLGAKVLIKEAAAESALTVVEEAGGSINFTVNTSKGSVEVISNIAQTGETLTLNELKQAAAQFGASRGATQVIVQGAARTTGRYAGQIPRPIVIPTGL